MRVWLYRAMIGAVVVMFLASCVWEHDIPVELDVPSEAAVYELEVYQLDICPEFDRLIDGYYIDSRVREQLFTVWESEPIGELAPGTYAFVAFGRSEDCRPMLFGCRLAEIGQVDRVVIPLELLESDFSFCFEDQECSEGFCFEPEGDEVEEGE